MAGLLLSALWYCAAAIAFVAAVAVLKPIRRLRLPTRPRAASVLAVSLAAIISLAILPPPLTTVASRVSRLDDVAPSYHYNEVHVRHVNAPPERVYGAVRATTASEIRLFQTLTWIRRFGRPGPESILNAPERLPLLDVATRGGFVLVADDPPRELVGGTAVVPGLVTATMNFRIEPEATGSRLTTETRVTGIDRAAIRRFTPYWRTILPGSWILRVTWLQAIARRAEMN